MKTIDEINEAFQRIHRYATQDGAPAYMSIPADPERDADLILCDAIKELDSLRANQADMDRVSAELVAMATERDKALARCVELEKDAAAVDQAALSATDSAEWLAQHDAEVRADMEKAIEAQAESVRMYAEKCASLEKRIAELEGNGLPNIEDRKEFQRPEDTSSLQALCRWVEAFAVRGEVIDTGFRCVSEGGDVFEFDPECVTRLYARIAELDGLFTEAATDAVAARNDAARAELRARDAVAAVKQVVAAHDARKTRHDGIYGVDWASTPDAHAVGQAFATALHVLVMESTAPDSDARLREVMERATVRALKANNGDDSEANLLAEAKRIIDDMLRGAP